MLETSQDRIKLLRAGFTGKEIEKLYNEGNNFKLIRFPVIVDLIEIEWSAFLFIPLRNAFINAVMY